MKKTSKFLLAAAMAMSTVSTPLAVMMTNTPVFAADESKVTITVPTGHTYDAYKIFSGDIEAENSLTHIEYANGVNPDVLIQIINAALLGTKNDSDVNYSNVKENATATQLVEVLNTLSDAQVKKMAAALNDAKSRVFTSTPTTIDAEYNQVDPGYYLLEDVTNNVGTGGYYGLTVLKVASNNVTIESKNDAPRVDKEVQDDDEPSWGEAADHEIGEEFKFKITGTGVTVGKIKDYKNGYKMVFHDHWSAGIEYVEIESVIVKAGENKTKSLTESDYTADHKAQPGENEDNLTITIEDLQNKLPDGVADNDTITVEVIYKAKLNASALINSSTDTNIQNKNNVYLEYSNKPSAEGTGKTEDDNVWVAAFKIVVTKEIAPLAATPNDENWEPDDVTFCFYYNVAREEL